MGLSTAARRAAEWPKPGRKREAKWSREAWPAGQPDEQRPLRGAILQAILLGRAAQVGGDGGARKST